MSERMTVDECKAVMTEVWGRNQQYIKQNYCADMKGTSEGMSFEEWTQHVVDAWAGVGMTVLMMHSKGAELCIEPQGDERIIYFRRLHKGDALPSGSYEALGPRTATHDLAADIQRAALRAVREMKR